MSGYRSEAERRIDRLAGFLDWLIRYDEAGILILLGVEQTPSAYDLFLKKQQSGKTSELPGTRITGGERSELALRVLEATEYETSVIAEAGGWEAIISAARRYRAELPRRWRLLERHALLVKPGGDFHDGDGGMSQRVAEEAGIHVRTVNRRRNKILHQIARFVYLPNGELRDAPANYASVQEEGR